jgi:putative oxidoreductase
MSLRRAHSAPIQRSLFERSDVTTVGRVPFSILGSPQERRDVLGWIMRAGLGALFIAIGMSKFNADPHGMWFQIFEKIGFGQWFRIVAGVMQVAGGVLFLFPGTCRFGAISIAATMIGAVVTDIVILGNPIMVVAPGALLAAIIIVGFRDPTLDSTIAMLEKRKRR